MTNFEEAEAFFASKAVEEGKGILDCGCTESMGTATSLETIAQKNLEKYGDTRLTVHVTSVESQPAGMVLSVLVPSAMLLESLLNIVTKFMTEASVTVASWSS